MEEALDKMESSLVTGSLIDAGGALSMPKCQWRLYGSAHSGRRRRPRMSAAVQPPLALPASSEPGGRNLPSGYATSEVTTPSRNTTSGATTPPRNTTSEATTPSRNTTTPPASNKTAGYEDDSILSSASSMTLSGAVILAAAAAFF
ncbi:hypothetical protein BASA61_007048 [Batrachochytrium salamandrivorans]|nr:hypothetical protein BASA61_007048 [Batrachochytrium salamandrivorans]